VEYPDDIQKRPADPFVRDRVEARNTGKGFVTIAGLLGDSDRTGSRRLYLTTRLDYFVEFRSDDVVTVEDVGVDEAPFPGLDATRVSLVGDATLDWTRRATGGADLFAVEARDAIVLPESVETWEARCPGITEPFGHSDFDPCRPGGGGRPGGGTFGPWPTQAGHTCATCAQDTCATCGRGTCNTCGRGTCVTCGQDTCVTCGGNTCNTCGRQTCEPFCRNPGGGFPAGTGATCDGTCSCPGATCEGTCVSCRGTCDASCGGSCQETCGETCNTCAGTCPTEPGWCIVRG